MKKSYFILMSLLMTSCSSVKTSSSLFLTTSSNNEVVISSSSNTSSSSNNEVVISSSSNISSSSISTLVSSSSSNASSQSSSKVSSSSFSEVGSEETIILNGDKFELESSGLIISNNVLKLTNPGNYEIKGEGNNLQIEVDCVDKVNLSLNGVKMVNDLLAPFVFTNASKVNLSSKRDSLNIIEDHRIFSESEINKGAITSYVDLDIQGNGTLKVYSDNYRGVDGSDDVEIKNLTLDVTSKMDGIKGNDGILIESGNLNIISKSEDGLKTSNSNISSKGNQKGSIKLVGGNVNLMCLTDAIDASYDIVIEEGVNLDIKTGKYSQYSEEKEEPISNKLYLKANSSFRNINFGIYYSLLDGSSNLVKTTKLNGNNRSTYYEAALPSDIKEMIIYGYDNSTSNMSTSNYKYLSDNISYNENFNCLSLSLSGSTINTNWTNYNPNNSGPGYNDSNNDKSTFSSKGLKAKNEIVINGGNLTIKANDDGIHARNSEILDNSNYGLGNVTINNGNIEIYSDDDGIHADNDLIINDGLINITNSYEGLEGNVVTINEGEIRLVSKDDGVNAVRVNKAPYIYINGGVLYLDSNGDGLDSNGNIEMNGGYVVALGPTNGGNGVLDFDGSFSFKGGYLLAIGASGMNQKPTGQSGTVCGSKSITTSTSSYVSLTVDNIIKIEMKVTKTNQNYCAYGAKGSSAVINVSSQNTNSLKYGLFYVG